MRTSENKLNSSLKKEIEKTLAQVISDIKNIEEAKEFLQSFFTESELEIFSKRLAIAYWLDKKRTYANIKNNLKVSSATIARIKNMMDKKSFKEALKKIEAEEWA